MRSSAGRVLRRLGASRDWRRFPCDLVDDGLLHSDLFTESLDGVLPIQLLQFCWRVLVDELVNGKVTATYSDLNVVLFDFDGNALGSELVDALALAHEHDLELSSLWVVVDVLCEPLVDIVLSHGYINCNLGF